MDNLNTFRFGGTYISYENFVHNVMESLKIYKFATPETIALAKKASKKEVYEAMKDGAIAYIRENPDLSIRDVCDNLKLKTQIIADLASEGRIVISDSAVEELLIEFAQAEQESNKRNKMLCLQEQSSGISAPLQKQQEEINDSFYKGATYHTKGLRRTLR